MKIGNDDPFQFRDKLIAFAGVPGDPVGGGERRSIDIIGATLHLTASGDDHQIASFFSGLKVFGSLDSDESVPVPRARLDRTVKSEDAQLASGRSLTIEVALTPHTRTSGHRKFRIEVDPKILKGAVQTWMTPCPLTYPSVDIRATEGSVAASLYDDAGNQQQDSKSGAAFTLSGNGVGTFRILVVGAANQSTYQGIAQGWVQL